MNRLLYVLIAVVLLLILVLSSCTANVGTAPRFEATITVGSKIDTEGVLLSQIIIVLLRDRGYIAIDKSQFGPTNEVRQALLSGELDIYPEYTGNGAFFFDEVESDVWHDAQKAYERVKQLDMEKNNIVWLKPAPANNTLTIAIPLDLSSAEDIRTLDDFAAYVNRGGDVKLIGAGEAVIGSEALSKFQEVYGFILNEDQLITASNDDTTQVLKAVSQGTGGANAAMVYGTDAALGACGLVVLGDPSSAQPVYQPAPTVRGELIEEHQDIAETLERVFARLSRMTLQGLNARIAIDGEKSFEVANSYLHQIGVTR